MGVGELRDAFNAGAPGYSCTLALLDYRRVKNVEWQVLTFRGTGPSDVEFEVVSDQLGPGTDLNATATETGRKFAASQKGTPAP